MPSINSIAVRSRPSGRPRPANFKSLLNHGSQVLDLLVQLDPDQAQEALAARETLGVAYHSSSSADARTALTRLQLQLMKWTAEDANVAAEGSVQRYRQLLHSVLDHGEKP